jgi:hypothetical protein
MGRKNFPEMESWEGEEPVAGKAPSDRSLTSGAPDGDISWKWLRNKGSSLLLFAEVSMGIFEVQSY